MAFHNLKKKTNENEECEYSENSLSEDERTESQTAVQVKCRIHVKRFKEDTILVSEPDDNPQWPEGLEFCDTRVQVKKGAQPYIILSVQNPTDHIIILTG